ncbi:hypothetical protein Ae168Ps1_6170 [Pseudonocardia sp. Ae168_Ps1]|jgi:hypothetical protein|uniref:ImmA/IrrE family metallo-endopeptidase n=1 Tax=unclassified Pseudonocardia TaxID=2619320 RepID=UPI00094ABBFE|nr:MULTISPECIES: hypothetical protein [unclassified Pseudonocardia]MCO7192323.1 hypothetical protein [Pseudonocardia sp. McavD-2-B]OLL70423.1 hypothetical protein Ae168Ps1_6170 [Pseudonocardia sp. Ae168_Ps1]OLL71542.1 hypothetical protein Ae263Ps1_6030 [Pseudonocardia sp. Ae263_Ps1]
MRVRRRAQSEEPASWTQLVARARRKLRDEGLEPCPESEVDLEAFAERLGQARGLTIRLLPVELGASARELCGLCTVPRPGVAVVFYAHAASELARRHNIAHELGHLFFDHQAHSARFRPSFSTVLSDSQQRLSAWMGNDPSYGAHDEAEADALGAALLGYGPGRRSHRWVATAEVRAAAARLESAFT